MGCVVAEVVVVVVMTAVVVVACVVTTGVLPPEYTQVIESTFTSA